MRFYWAIIILILFHKTAKSQGFSLDNIAERYFITPGTVTSIPFTMLNNQPEVGQYIISAESPIIGIELFNKEKKVVLDGFQKHIFILPIKISSDCPSGENTIKLKIVNCNTQKEQTYTIKITVTTDNSLSIKPLTTEDYTKAGDTIQADFIIKNTGNIPQEIILNSVQGKIDGGLKRLTLKPNSENIITVKKETNPKEGQLKQEIIDLAIHRTTNKDDILYAYGYTTVIPINPPKLDAFLRLPIRASLSYVNLTRMNETEQGWQGEINAIGSLNNNPSHIFQLRMVTKNPIEQNSYSQYEEYYARFSSNKLMIHLGDNAYTSSILTENTRYGRGAEVQYTADKFVFGAFYNKPRYFKDIKDEFNLNTQYTINDNIQVSLGYLQKRPSNDSVYFSNKLTHIAHLPYAILKFNTIKNTTIETEYAYSKSGKLQGEAVRLQAATTINNLSASFSILHTSPNYSGYFRNSTNLNAVLNYRISSKLSAFINHFQDAKNIQRDTLFLEAPYRNFTQLGGSYYYTTKGNLNVTSGFMHNEDRLAKRLFNYDEYYVKTTLAQTIGSFQLDLSNHFGYTKNFLTQTNGNSSVYQVNIAYNRPKTHIGMFGSISKTPRYNNMNTKHIYYGGYINNYIGSKTAINIRYQNNYAPEEYYRDRNQLGGGIIQKIGQKHILEFHGRYMLHRGQLGEKDFITSIKYIALINLPIKRVATYTSLSGVISSDNTNTLSGIKVQLGNQIAITDKNGMYYFKNIIPGDYYLDVDKSTLPLEAISDIVLPMAISLHPNTSNQQNIDITKAATINGRVTIINENTSQTSILDMDQIKNSNVILEIRNEKQIFRKICKVDSKFDFTYLRPGIWTVKVYANNLGNNLKINNDSFELDLKQKEVKSISIDIRIVHKEIRYQQETLKVGYINSK